jgi:dihydrofolate reductase
MPIKRFDIIVSATWKSHGISRDGNIPWRISHHMAFFRDCTTFTDKPGMINCCIMGRRTYESLDKDVRPLPGRLNIVLTTRNPDDFRKSTDAPSDLLVCATLEDALHCASMGPYNVDRIFVIGGAGLFTYALAHSHCRRVFVTWVHEDVECDLSFPLMPKNFYCITSSGTKKSGSYKYQLCEYIRLRRDWNHIL